MKLICEIIIGSFLSINVMLILPVTDAIPLSVSALSPRVQAIYSKLRDFIAEHIGPLEEQHAQLLSNPDTVWTVPPMIKELQVSQK